jgi:hypothetical protein
MKSNTHLFNVQELLQKGGAESAKNLRAGRSLALRARPGAAIEGGAAAW